MNKEHNLDVHMYNLKELLELFEIYDYRIDLEQIKKAKRKVLMTHPDKSKLPSKYFLFYKKAFDIVYKFYDEQNKQNQTVEKRSYKPIDEDPDDTNAVKTKINKVKSDKFQKEFNKLFEENMMTKIDTSKNDWFKKEDNDFKIDTPVNSGNMGQIFRQMKKNNQDVMVYKGVQNMNYTTGESLYDDEDDNAYCSGDIFGKLKYDDLRKVHKDNTIFDVCETDYNKVQGFNNIQQLQTARNTQNLNPMNEQRANHMMEENERVYREKMMNKQHQSSLKSMEYAEKNKQVMGSLFLRIEN